MTSPIEQVRRQPLAVALAVLAILTASLAMFLPHADAQQGVVGSADFRNAPHIGPGSYSDRIVTGDSAWYSVAYTNNTDYRFEVALQGPAGDADVELTVSFVAPTLDTVDGPAPVLSGSGFRYKTGHTNIWFLKVSLDAADQPGVEYPIVLTVEGLQSVGADRCDELAGCTLDDELRTLKGQLAQASAQLEEAQAQPTRADVERDLANLDGFVESSDALLPIAQQRLAQAQESMADLCAPEVTCETFPDPGTKTPIIGWILGLLFLGFGVFRAIKKLGRAISPPSDDDDDDGTSTKPRVAASASRARSAKS